MDVASVSVVIPVFEARETLKAALASVAAQTLQPLEILVVDDASPVPPDVPAPARTLRAPRNRGPAAARNLGIAAARGRFVAFLDADDLWLPGKLAAQAEAALARPQSRRLPMRRRNLGALARGRPPAPALAP